MEGNMNDSFLENNDAEKFKNEYLECSENFTNAFLETQQAKININNKKAIWNETVNKINEAENQLKAMNDPYQLFEEKMEQSYDPQNDVRQELSLMEKILETPTLSALEVLTEAVALQTEKVEHVTKLKILTESVCEAEVEFFNKDDEFKLSRRLYEECLDDGKVYFESEYYASLVTNTEKQVELAKKLEQGHEEVLQKTEDLNMQ
ncbi:hypothetical protein L3Y34_012265 [Caenorhabditis briggsae]|uniref:Uncharacterized protein n=1 Tax=Caenorhabditis briggsae TaxID=6238 RepID=A0AAE9CVK6_CAEBR|nr:hypothetical protein L3Y34_012265 [Caenorhabditis briggsae]